MNKLCLFISLLFAVAAAPITAQPLLLEDFVTWRNNLEGTKLFDAYRGETGVGQTSTVDSGSLKVVGYDTVGRGVYIHCLTRGTNGYAGAGGKAKDYVLSGTWDNEINRLSFLMQVNKNIPRRIDGGDNIQFGTYISPITNTSPNNQGAHYYHLANVTFDSGSWYKVDLTQWPQHRVSASGSINWPNDPEYKDGAGLHYFDGLTRFYIHTQGPNYTGATVRVSDFYFRKVANQPDTIIGTLVYGYTGSGYFVSWASRKNLKTTFEVRYSDKPMSVHGWDSGFDGGITSNSGNAYCGVAWEKVMPEYTTGIYVAIRAQGQTQFAEVSIPYKMKPGNSFIATPTVPVCVPVRDTVTITRVDTLRFFHTDTLRIRDTLTVVDTLYRIPKAFNIQVN